MTATLMTTRQEEIREKALQDLQQFQVLMLDGHFDFGNGYHGRLYLNPHRLFRYPSTIWRFAQNLIDVLPGSVLFGAAFLVACDVIARTAIPTFMPSSTLELPVGVITAIIGGPFFLWLLMRRR